MAIGAIASGGVRIVNEEITTLLHISESVINAVAHQEQQELERREKLYRGTRPKLDVQGRTVILIHDG